MAVRTRRSTFDKPDWRRRRYDPQGPVTAADMRGCGRETVKDVYWISRPLAAGQAENAEGC